MFNNAAGYYVVNNNNNNNRSLVTLVTVVNNALLLWDTGWCVSVSQPPAEVCLTDLAWDYPGV